MHSQAHHKTMFPVATSTCLLNPCRDGDSTPSLGILTALSVNNFFLISNLNLLCCHLMKEGLQKVSPQYNPIPATHPWRNEHPRRVSTSLPSPRCPSGLSQPAERGSPPAAAASQGLSPPLSQLEITLGRELCLGTERSSSTCHCSVGNCFLSFPLSW